LGKFIIRCPFATTRGVLARGVVNSGANPFTVFLVLPFLWFNGVCSTNIELKDLEKLLPRSQTWVGNCERLFVKPSFRFHCLLINNLIRGILIPVVGLMFVG